MTKPVRHAACLLVAALLSPSLQAQDFLGIDFSDVTLKAFTSVSTQLAPIKTDSDTHSAPQDTPNSVEALVVARGTPFPNLPNSVGSAFASSAGSSNGVFGVGVNGFFPTNSLPPDALLASGSSTQTITNNSTVTVTLFAHVTIPAPTLQFFGVGNFFPAGADLRRDVTGLVDASLFSKITHPGGSVVESTPLDYGMSLFREPASGLLLALPSKSAGGGILSRFDEFDGSFGFRLPAFQSGSIEIGVIAPGDVLEITFDYVASASTGFGETGIFAAIGDPFDLTVGGPSLDLHVAAIPEPAPWLLLAVGLATLMFRTHGRAANRRPVLAAWG